jgi:hypothetical protein
VTALLVLVVVLAVWFVVRRANELAVLDVRNGHARLRRGRAPARFLLDVEEVVRRAGIERATIRVVSESGAPRVEVSGSVSAGVVQQIRNVAGEHQVSHFRTGRRP